MQVLPIKETDTEELGAIQSILFVQDLDGTVNSF